MRNSTNTALIVATIGLDLGNRTADACVLDEGSGEVRERFRVTQSAEGLRRRFGARPRSRIVMEACGASPWVSRLMSEIGHEVIVADTRRLALITRSDQKTDRNDAENLARLGRADPKLIGKVHHRRAQAQVDLEIIKARDVLVRSRTSLINHVRGVLKSVGSRAPGSTAESFHRKCGIAVPEVLQATLEPLLDQIGATTAAIKQYDKRIEEVAKKAYPVTDHLRAIRGVGPITALAYVLVLDDPHRFRSSRRVGAYLGLTPASRQSGARDPQMSISKAGNPFVRRLLVSCAQYVLGPFGEDCALRRFGLALCERGGPNAKRRAVVAVARKLAVVLHRLWVTGEIYEPMRAARPQ